jgi:tRNA1(Val) A37 N6-methylase TrmN6
VLAAISYTQANDSLGKREEFLFRRLSIATHSDTWRATMDLMLLVAQILVL